MRIVCRPDALVESVRGGKGAWEIVLYEVRTDEHHRMEKAACASERLRKAMLEKSRPIDEEERELAISHPS